MSVSLEKIKKLSQLMMSGNSGDHFHALGMAFSRVERGKIYSQMPYSEATVGNPDDGAVYGGALTALLDTTCGFAAVAALDQFTLCPTMDLRVDYLQSAKPGLMIYAEAQAYRVTSSVIFCRAVAYQDNMDNPIANCVANFTRMEPRVADAMSADLEAMLAHEDTRSLGQADPVQPKFEFEPPVLSQGMSLMEVVAADRKLQRPELLVDALPYARLLGIQALHQGKELVLHLPPCQRNVGNPTLPSLHGGAIAGFMEMSAAIYLLMNMETPSLPRVVDFSIDYLRAGRLDDTYTSCTVVRQGRKLVNVSVLAWQRTREKPIAAARVHFLVD